MLLGVSSLWRVVVGAILASADGVPVSSASPAQSVMQAELAWAKGRCIAAAGAGQNNTCTTIELYDVCVGEQICKWIGNKPFGCITAANHHGHDPPWDCTKIDSYNDCLGQSVCEWNGCRPNSAGADQNNTCTTIESPDNCRGQQICKWTGDVEIAEEVGRCDPLDLDACKDNMCAYQEYEDRCRGCMCYTPGGGNPFCDGKTAIPGIENSGCSFEPKNAKRVCWRNWMCKSKKCRFGSIPAPQPVVGFRCAE